jgi:UDP-N-acetylmuramyl tripeptide synthase
LDVLLQGDRIEFRDGQAVSLELSLPGRANRANAAMAASVAGVLGVDPQMAVAAMRDVREVVGRYAAVCVAGCEARLLLAKNPAGWLEVFDFLRPAPLPVVVAINARIADGRDPSWLWDVPFERLRDRFVVATGERSRDLAVRLHYAEVDHVHEPNFLRAIPAAGASSVDVVANYTAFQQMWARFT